MRLRGEVKLSLLGFQGEEKDIAQVRWTQTRSAPKLGKIAPTPIRSDLM